MRRLALPVGSGITCAPFQGMGLAQLSVVCRSMNRSKYIARLMGPVMLVIGIGMALGLVMEGDGYSSLLKEFIGSRALIFITGVLALVAGLAIVNAHNLWVRDWRVIVTILGWLFVLRGIMLLALSRAGADARRPHRRGECRRAWPAPPSPSSSARSSASWATRICGTRRSRGRAPHAPVAAQAATPARLPDVRAAV